MVSKKSDDYGFEMKHRGLHTKIVHEKNVVFFHEHLPIQASFNDNPIIETERFIILFNGEIFHDDYDNDLEYIADTFKANPLFGAIEDIIQQDGFYSFIIYDKDHKNIYCFTDPLGKKQLYFNNKSIASELRPLAKGSINNLHLTKTIKFGYVTDDSTPYWNIKRVLPNQLYTFNINFELLNVSDTMYKFQARQGDLYDLIDKAVINRLKGHENIGLLLSGGLDSSIIHHHIDKQRKHLELTKEVNTYCVDNLGDYKYAKSIDKNVELIELNSSDKALAAMEMPMDLGSMYPQYSLFEQVDETVILTGDGADEAFGGYRRMNEYDSQLSDIFDELVYYHNVRLDRMSMIHTKEVRSPFMSLKVIEYALGLPYEQRVNKQHLRDRYKGILHTDIVNRPKEPLKTDIIRDSVGTVYRKKLVDKWLKENQ